VGMLRKTRHREEVGWMLTFAAAAYNLVGIKNLLLVVPQHKLGDKCAWTTASRRFGQTDSA
jgi:hypothetical protein